MPAPSTEKPRGEDVLVTPVTLSPRTTTIWHAALPLIAYAGLVGAGIGLSRRSAGALFIVGGSALLLVFIGIHNAWDTVMYVTLERARQHQAATKAPARPAAPQSAPPAGKDVEPPGPPPARNP